MEPSADTYQTMMNYHASKGDVEAIKQVRNSFIWNKKMKFYVL